MINNTESNSDNSEKSGLREAKIKAKEYWKWSSKFIPFKRI